MFIKAQKDPLSTLLKHLGTSAILGIVLKMIATEQTPEVTGVIAWLRDAGLVKQLADKFDPELDDEVHANASLALIDIMDTTQSIDRLGVIMPEIVRPEIISTVLDNMLKPGRNHLSSLQHGFAFLTDVLQRSLGYG